MRAAVLAGFAIAAPARAEPDVTADADLGVREAASLFAARPGPYLFAPIAPPSIVGLGTREDTQRASIRLGAALLTVDAGGYLAYADAVPLDGSEHDLVARGSRAGVTLSYHLGFARLDARLERGSVSSRYGSGGYRERSLSLTRTHRFSRWVTAWIALSIGNRVWDGDPPPGEAKSATQIGISIGTTFR